MNSATVTTPFSRFSETTVLRRISDFRELIELRISEKSVQLSHLSPSELMKISNF